MYSYTHLSLLYLRNTPRVSAWDEVPPPLGGQALLVVGDTMGVSP